MSNAFRFTWLTNNRMKTKAKTRVKKTELAVIVCLCHGERRKKSIGENSQESRDSLPSFPFFSLFHSSSSVGQLLLNSVVPFFLEEDRGQHETKRKYAFLTSFTEC